MRSALRLLVLGLFIRGLFVLAGGLAFGVAAAHAAGMNPFGPSGLPLTDRDFAAMATAVDPLLNDETTPIGTVRSWSNASSGNQGTITLEGRFTYDYQGKTLPCRKLRYHTVIRNYADPYNLRINRCKVADGNWMLL
jgi:surface antigen